jgi:hypothetical protein
MRNRSAQATSGRQNPTLTATTMTIITPMAISTLPSEPCSTAAAT